MNPSFKLRFDQMREGNPSASDDLEGPRDTALYQQPGYARNLCLVWPDGRRLFLNYAYLLASAFEPNADANQIKLSFSSHTVLVQGYSLDTLFMDLFDHRVRIITAVDPRYVLDEDKTGCLVTAISVEQKE